MWTQTQIAEKPCDIFEPSPGTAPRHGLLFLHPLSGNTLRDNEAYTRQLEHHRLACVSPRSGESWWTDRIYPPFDPSVSTERFLLQQVLPFFRDRWGLRPRSIGVFGISMGGQAALRLAFKHPQVFPVAVGIASAIDYHDRYGQGNSLDDLYDSKEQCRQDTAVMHVPPVDPPAHLFFCVDPEDAEWYRGNDRLHEKLNALGVPHTIDFTTRAGGHSWSYYDAQAEAAVRFLVDGLQKESLRLL